jgi:outer membrane immunogenic protein
MPVRKYLPSAIVLAWMAVTPALADDLFAAPPSDGWYNNLLSQPRSSAVAPPKYADWRGLYAGGQVSYSDAHADFSESTQAPISYALRFTDLEQSFTPSNWTVLGSANHGGFGGGGFVGYNFEYLTPDMNVVLGFEANFDIASLSVFSPNTPITRLTPASNDGNTYLVNITGGGQVSNLEFSTLRGRVGWGIGNFLPYAFVGFALGNANIGVTETISGEVNPPSVGVCSAADVPPCTRFSYTGTAGKNAEWLYGVTAGAGLDIAVSRNFFVRTEYEYVQFQPGVRHEHRYQYGAPRRRRPVLTKIFRGGSRARPRSARPKPI